MFVRVLDVRSYITLSRYKHIYLTTHILEELKLRSYAESLEDIYALLYTYRFRKRNDTVKDLGSLRLEVKVFFYSTSGMDCSS